MGYVVKRTGLHGFAPRGEDGRQPGCAAFDETLVDGVDGLDEACRVLLDHRDQQRPGSADFTELSVVSPHGETVAWLDENLNLVLRASAEIIEFRKAARAADR